MAETINYIHNNLINIDLENPNNLIDIDLENPRNLIDVYLEEPYTLIDIELENNRICIICFGICSETENIHSASYIRNNCNCSYDVHEMCLDIWLKKQKTCIICRNSITKNEVKSVQKKIMLYVPKCVKCILWWCYGIVIVLGLICVVIFLGSVIRFLF